VVDQPASDGLTWQPITQADLDDLGVLLTAIEHLDEPSERHNMDALSDAFVGPDASPSEDSLLGRDGGGMAVAYAWNHPATTDLDPRRVYLTGGVHPGWRRQGIGRQLLAWQLDRAREWYDGTYAELVGPLQLTAYVDEKLDEQQRLYRAAGLAPVRWFADMGLTFEHDADGTPRLPATGEVPAGIRLVPYSKKLSEAVRLAHNDAFSEHWGSKPVARGPWEDQLSRAVGRSSWSWVALDAATSEVAGYAINSAYEQDWEAQGFSEGWTERLGVRRAFRGRGIARALLVASMASFAEAGLDGAGIGVDSDTPTGSINLYPELGYTATSTIVMYATLEHRAPDAAGGTSQ